TLSAYCEAAEATASLNAVAAAALKAWPWRARPWLTRRPDPSSRPGLAAVMNAARPSTARSTAGGAVWGFTVSSLTTVPCSPNPAVAASDRVCASRLEATVPLRVIVWFEIVAVASVYVTAAAVVVCAVVVVGAATRVVVAAGGVDGRAGGR